MKTLHLFIFCLLANIAFTQTVQLVTPTTGNPNRMLIINDELYYSESINNKISKIDLTNSSPNPINVTTLSGTPASLAFDGTWLYIAVYGQGKISKIDLTNSSAIPIDIVTGLSYPNGLALVGNDLYFSVSGSILKIDISNNSSSPTTVLTGLNFPTSLLSHEGHLYISQTGGNKISKIDLSSSSPSLTDVITGVNNPTGLKINCDTMYFASYTNNKVSKFSLLENTPTLIDIATGFNGLADIIFYGNDLYTCEHDAQKISKIENTISNLGDCCLDNLANNTCNAPTNISHSLGFPARCHITWDPLPCALRYDVHYKKQTETTWTRTGALNPYKTLHYLEQNTIYQYFVRSTCDGTWDFSLSSPIYSFNTGNIPSSRINTTINSQQLKTFPNPAYDRINLEYYAENESASKLLIFDIAGNIVFHQSLQLDLGQNVKDLNISSLNAGYYTMILGTEGEKSISKFVVVK